MSIEHPRQSVEAELARFLRHDAQRTDREAGLVAERIAAVEADPRFLSARSRPLPRIMAKVASPQRQRPLRLGGRNRSSCPQADVER